MLKKQHLVISLFTLLLATIEMPVEAQLSNSTSAPSSTMPSSGFKQLPPLDSKSANPNQSQPPPAALPAPGSLTRPVPPSPHTLTYFHPGTLIFKNGKWEGNDNLLNVSNRIGVYVEILKPPKDTLAITNEQIAKIIDDIFAKANISPMTLVEPNQAPLPAFHMKIFLYPLSEGYAGFCEARLFESVTPQRFNLDPNMAFQAITWQRETLFLEPKAIIIKAVKDQVGSITQNFVDIYSAYQRRHEENFLFTQ